MSSQGRQSLMGANAMTPEQLKKEKEKAQQIKQAFQMAQAMKNVTLPETVKLLEQKILDQLIVVR